LTLIQRQIIQLYKVDYHLDCLENIIFRIELQKDFSNYTLRKLQFRINSLDFGVLLLKHLKIIRI